MRIPRFFTGKRHVPETQSRSRLWRWEESATCCKAALAYFAQCGRDLHPEGRGALAAPIYPSGRPTNTVTARALAERAAEAVQAVEEAYRVRRWADSSAG